MTPETDVMSIEVKVRTSTRAGMGLALSTLALGLAIASGCVSRSAYKDLEARLKAAEREKSALKEELDSRKMKRIEAMEVQLASCNHEVAYTKEAGEKLAKKAEEAGYYRGAADFNRSLQIVGLPNSSGAWIFADHFYTFQVKVAGQPLYSMTIETEDEMPPVLQGLAMLAELSEVLPYKPKM